jgi:ABC-type branched-chain amino acid transport systems, periplasmic component
VVLLLVLATACQSGPSPTPRADILIASDFPLLGSDFSVQQTQAIQLAIKQQGDIEGFKLGYLPFDDFLGHSASQPKGIQNVKHMIADARVLGMIGPWTSNMAYGEIPRANPADLAMVSPANTSDCITVATPICRSDQPPWQHQSHPNNYFRIAAPESLQGRAIARYLRESLNVKRVAAFNEWGGGGDLYIKELGDELARAGGKLVLSQPLDDGTTSFKSFLESAKAAGAQAIFAVGSGDSHVCAARAQMAGIFPAGAYFLGVDGIVSWSGLTSEAAIDDSCIKDAIGNGDGMLTATSDVDLTRNKDAASMKVVAAFRHAYPQTTDIASYMFATYDSARILIDAIQGAIRANGGRIPTRAQVVSAIAQAHFEGVTGTYSFDAHGDALSPMMSIYRVENDHWVLVKPIDISAK